MEKNASLAKMQEKPGWILEVSINKSSDSGCYKIISHALEDGKKTGLLPTVPAKLKNALIATDLAGPIS